MTQEEKQLLLIDLCERLPYGIKVSIHDWDYPAVVQAVYSNLDVLVNDVYRYSLLGECSLYLRPMSSMTEEEVKEFHHMASMERNYLGDGNFYTHYRMIDWLNSHHFDYRGLIPMGLALEAPEDMYQSVDMVHSC